MSCRPSGGKKTLTAQQEDIVRFVDSVDSPNIKKLRSLNYITMSSPLLIPDSLLNIDKGPSEAHVNFLKSLPRYRITADTFKRIFSIGYSDDQINFECCKKASIYFYRTGKIAGLSFRNKDLINKNDQDQNLLALYDQNGEYSGYLLTGQKDTVTCKKKTNIKEFEISAKTYNHWTIDTFMTKKNIRMTDEEVKKMILKNGGCDDPGLAASCSN